MTSFVIDPNNYEETVAVGEGFEKIQAKNIVYMWNLIVIIMYYKKITIGII